MKNDKPIEISVKTVFSGVRSTEQAFIDLIRLHRRKAAKSTNGLELIPNLMYNGNVVFPGVHVAPERGICYE
jgi:hypothetical protein